MVFRDVGLEAISFFIEGESVKVADEALVFHIVFDEFLLFAQLGKGIDNNTEQNVKQDNLNQDVERCIVEKFDEILVHLVRIVD